MTPCSCTILLVDDDALVLEALNEFFCDTYQTVLARTGSEAIEALMVHPDIVAVVLDLKMAGLDGIETCQEIKKRNRELPIIIHTGNPAEYKKREAGTLLEPFDFIQKGNSLAQLDRSVRNACAAYRQRKLLKLDNQE